MREHYNSLDSDHDGCDRIVLLLCECVWVYVGVCMCYFVCVSVCMCIILRVCLNWSVLTTPYINADCQLGAVKSEPKVGRVKHKTHTPYCGPEEDDGGLDGNGERGGGRMGRGGGEEDEGRGRGG